MENPNNSCEYATLHHNECGYVVQCHHCGGYQLAFGTIQLNLLPHEFDAFFEYVAMQRERLGIASEMSSKNVFIPTDSLRVTMVFTGHEIKQLYDLLQQAKLIQQIYRSLYDQPR